ncbi:unnamed protein product [Urochloa decumbens]|uniref:Protein kinase domain-containing protein n=1 Tax=Urochloa decumbens TaxID=240449 RepID=A0ABC9BEQ9_9POAL
MRTLAAIAVTLLQLAVAAAIAVAVAAAAAPFALPGCQSKCGELDIPYPFGTTDGCYRPGFKVTCDPKPGAGVAQRLKLGNNGDGPAVLEISVENSTVRVRSSTWFFAVGNTSMARLAVVPDGGPHPPYVLNPKRNRLVHIGCGFRVSLWRVAPGAERAFNTCYASCREDDLRKIRSSRCEGHGCCDVPIPAGGGLTSFSARFRWPGNNNTGCPKTSSPWIASGVTVAVVERRWWRDETNVFNLKMSMLAFGRASGAVAPAILDWVFDNNSTCTEVESTSDYGCVSKHSKCVDSTGSALGYVCKCSSGYQGNPYVRDGCQKPRRRLHLSAGIIFAMGVGIGMFLLLLAIVTIFATKSFKDRKARKMREYFFKQNRGLLLRQLVDKDIAERMIFSLEELEKATNKFDKTRILGGGGHGTVYKGILSNQHVVAIKMSKLVIQREIDGFINEVAILSQINHRNVVKLFGCCLETEVPLLVYEFIPNGTLYAHLHVDGPTSLPWKDRLRIAFEVATSLAYLHSSASMSIVHRDIKSSNILLDDRLTAKVSDFGASRGITIDESGVTTAVQGTYGYLDPEYYYTRRLTEKSDIYSYGVMLVELLTRKKPTTDMSQYDVSLVAHFIQLLSKDRLSEILDVQVIEEGEEEAKQVAAIAALCVQMKGNDRPTMRHVEMRLQGIQSPNNNFQSDPGVQGLLQIGRTTFEGSNNIVVHDNNSRRYSMEREILLSATLPR